MAAVQAIFQWQEGEHAPGEIIDQFLKVRIGEQGEGGMRRDADRPLFKDVVEGTVAHKEELQQTLTGAGGGLDLGARRPAGARHPARWRL